MRYVELGVQSNVSFGDFSRLMKGVLFSPLGENAGKNKTRTNTVLDPRPYHLWDASEELAGCTHRRGGGATVTRATARKPLSAFALWRALWFWRLKFLVGVEAAVGQQQGRLGETGKA